MLKHYWRTTIRNIGRSKLFTAINLIGLSLGIAVFLSLGSYVRYQYGFDRFYEGGERIYRVNYYEYQEGQPVLQSARTFDRTSLLVHAYVPQVEAVTRVYNEKAYIWNENVRMVDQDMLFVDSSFFKVFPVKILAGSAANALVAPNSVMVSRSQAWAYFGDEDPVGKVLFFNERLPITITGVFEDIPEQSSVDFDWLVSWSTLYYYGWVPREGNFRYPWTFTFVKLIPGVNDLAGVNNELTRMVNEHVNDLKLKGHTASQELQAYTDLHLSPPLTGEIKPGAGKTLLYALMGLAIFILASAWINYINLSLARSIERADEIGVRKAFGASRGVITGQFIMEAVLLSCAALAVGVGLYFLATGPLSNSMFSDHAFSTPDTMQWIVYALVLVIGTSLAAFYPALFISRFKPALILKNKLVMGRGQNGILHQGLMVFQLFMAVAVVGATLIANRQIAFIQSFDTGFRTQQTIALRAPASTNSDSLRYVRYTQFRNEVLQLPGFKSGTASMNIPGEEIRYHDEAIHAVGSSNLQRQSYNIMWIDEGYQETFGMTLLAGRNFNQKEPGLSCILTESAARALGYQEPVTAVNTSILTSDKKTFTVVGIWKDYHHESLHKPVLPIIFFHHHPHEYGYYSFQMEAVEGDILEPLKRIWSKHYPNDGFNYYFMDRFFQAQYQSDRLFEKLLTISSFISVVVASLGLFGMASLAMVKRLKEIGVRKVLGASLWNILLMLSTHYIRLVVISCLFAFPATIYLTGLWLEGFAYKMEIQWWMVAVPGIVVLIAMLLAISGQSIKAALTNPAQVLKSE